MSELYCTICENSMLPPVRPQGGGSTIKKTCSFECLKVYKAQQALEKYWKEKLKSLGLTESDIQKELIRQNNSCYGCLKLIDRRTCRLDHDHKTNKFRGLLCDICNSSLGLLKESPSTMRRLTAYLDHDRTVISIYLIGSLKNARVLEIGNKLRLDGYDVMDEWVTPGPEADENWQKYERQRGRSYSEALRGRAATNIFLFDRSYLDLSDIVILVAPAGKSAMIELGYAKGRGKRAYIFLDGQDPERFDIMPGFADAIFTTEEELISHLKGLQNGKS